MEKNNLERSQHLFSNFLCDLLERLHMPALPSVALSDAVWRAILRKVSKELAR